MNPDDLKIEDVVSRKVYYVNSFSDRGEVALVLDTKKNPPRIEGTTLHFISPEGFHSLDITKITKIGKKKHYGK